MLSMNRGRALALVAAAGFGLGIPFSQMLLEHIHVTLLAGLLYLGVVPCVTVYRWFVPRDRVSEPPLRRKDVSWVVLGIAAGGLAGPLLLLYGLERTPAGSAALILALEAVFTALIAAQLFAEVLTRRMLLGILAITSSAVLLGARDSSGWGVSLGAVMVAAATLGWAIDNNVTAKLSDRDPIAFVRYKALIAGTLNLGIAVALGTTWPGWVPVLGALALGAVVYGVSFICFMVAMRFIGAARTAAFGGTAPFIAAALSAVLFAESRHWLLMPAGVAAGVGLWVLFREWSGERSSIAGHGRRS